MNGRVFYIGSPSKTLAPGLRLGYVVAPREAIVALRRLRRLMLRHVASNNERALALFLAQGALRIATTPARPRLSGATQTAARGAGETLRQRGRSRVRTAQGHRCGCDCLPAWSLTMWWRVRVMLT